jgi:large conductance mechanosensitive channel
VLDLIIVSCAIFIFVKQISRLKKGKAPALPAGPTNEEKLLIEIRDAIKGRH